MKDVVNWGSSIGVITVPFISHLYGDSKIVLPIMVALVFFIFMDWLSGISAARKDNSYSSKYGLSGIPRTIFILLFPAGGHLLDQALGLPDFLFGLFAFGVLYHTLQSMGANVIRAGWGDYIPNWILDKVLKWVKSELESKLERAATRRERKGE